MVQTLTRPNKDASAGTAQPKRAIINGDDFGFSHGVNRAIVQAHREGILTSTSLMVTGDAFEEAVDLAKGNPKLAVGLHLVVVCGRSELPQSTIPNLVDSNQIFPYGPERTGLRYQFNRAARAELPLEIRAQLEKFRQTGLPLSHVDGHLHMHSHPVVFKSLVGMAREFGIKVIRLPREELRATLKIDRSNLLNKLLWWSIFGMLGNYGERILAARRIRFADRVYGLLQSGRMNESYFLELIPQIQGSLIEIYSHPALALAGEASNGPPGAGPAELEALISSRVREALGACGFQLTNYLEAW
jgi:hopanoid biosynthesis associated protein HpnK